MSIFSNWLAEIQSLKSKSVYLDGKGLPEGYYIPKILGINGIICPGCITFQVGISNPAGEYFPELTRPITLKITEDIQGPLARLFLGNPSDTDMVALNSKAINSSEYQSFAGFRKNHSQGNTYDYVGDNLIVFEPLIKASKSNPLSVQIASVGLPAGPFEIETIVKLTGSMLGRFRITSKDLNIIKDCQATYGEFQTIVSSGATTGGPASVYFECWGSGLAYLRNTVNKR